MAAAVTSVSSVSCDRAKASHRTDTAFQYREIYMDETMGNKARSFGLNAIDYDWGIWGHNLPDVLPKEPSLTIYAKKDGVNPVYEQFCFSSNHLYDYICDYIIDNYGEDNSTRFAILPNDNSVVCTGTRCTAAGNTKDNASPAVFALIRRLCERFPNHTFFTSDYLTTQQIPDEPLPSNSGVLVSAINYPRLSHASDKEGIFMDRIKQWKEKVPNVYVWDYMCNYDDYFTPFPIFSAMQQRLQAYEKAGVNGIFLNGSGHDYTTFGNLKAHVLAALTDNPDLDWKELLKTLCDRFYPTAGDLIYNFIVAQEEFAVKTDKELPMYDGVNIALKTYLPKEQFIEFYDRITDFARNAQGDEKAELEKALGAMSLTRLEVDRIDGNIDNADTYMKRLRGLVNKYGIESYNESYWSVSDYLKGYGFLVEHAREVGKTNLLKGKTIIPRTPLDEDYNDISIITDGMLALPSNYHSGHMISSADPSLVLEVPYVEGMKKLRVCFTINQAYKIGLPELVTLNTKNGTSIGSVTPERLEGHQRHSFVEFDIPPSNREPLIITCIKNPNIKTMAVEEIEAF